jgi:hypothetical protein
MELRLIQAPGYARIKTPEVIHLGISRVDGLIMWFFHRISKPWLVVIKTEILYLEHESVDQKNFGNEQVINFEMDIFPPGSGFVLSHIWYGDK